MAKPDGEIEIARYKKDPFISVVRFIPDDPKISTRRYLSYAGKANKGKLADRQHADGLRALKHMVYDAARLAEELGLADLAESLGEAGNIVNGEFKRTSTPRQDYMEDD